MLPIEVRHIQAPQVYNQSQRLGQTLFNDKGLSLSKDLSCATCHDPENNFQDTNDETNKRFPALNTRALGIRGVKDQPWFYWDGRADSLWAQIALALRKDHQLSETQASKYVCNTYHSRFPALLSFCNSEDKENVKFVEISKIIASYVATLEHYWTRVDEFIYQASLIPKFPTDILSQSEIAGMKLFFDRNKTGCTDCHSGYRYTNNGFFSIGTGSNIDSDRLKGGQKYLSSPYRCELWDSNRSCTDKKYIRLSGYDLKGALKVPSLRNLADGISLMHDGRFDDLEQVIEYYRNPYKYPLEHIDIRPLRLLPHERQQLISFLEALNDKYHPTS